jgi:hypothetical protein
LPSAVRSASAHPARVAITPSRNSTIDALPW